jgi:hypothetical protein
MYRLLNERGVHWQTLPSCACLVMRCSAYQPPPARQIRALTLGATSQDKHSSLHARARLPTPLLTQRSCTCTSSTWNPCRSRDCSCPCASCPYPQHQRSAPPFPSCLAQLQPYDKAAHKAGTRPSITLAAHRSRRAHARMRHACNALCPTGSRAAAPTAALPGGRRQLPSGTSPHPTGSRAAAPTAALPGGRHTLPDCTSARPKGSRANIALGVLRAGRRPAITVARAHAVPPLPCTHHDRAGCFTRPPDDPHQHREAGAWTSAQWSRGAKTTVRRNG